MEPVRDLIEEVLAARFSEPYPADIIDQVGVAIESDATWRRRYDELVKRYGRAGDGDSRWRVNNEIGRYLQQRTGMMRARSSVPSKNKLMNTYSQLRYPDEGEKDPFARAVRTLKALRPALDEAADLVEMQRARDEVYARYGNGGVFGREQLAELQIGEYHVFAPERLAELKAEEYQSFLLFKNNHHWTGITHYISRTTRDMDALRRGLAALLDESRPLAERYNEADGAIFGIGRAILTPILHVVYPDRYGVWNSKSDAGLRELGVLPPREEEGTDGQAYEAINDVLLGLAEALEIDLWTLDALWEALARRKPLAAPFDAIFADRAQAEWAFDLFAGAVEQLGGGPDDPRFALTHGGALIRLNIGNSMVVDISNRGRKMHLTALIDEIEGGGFAFPRSEDFRVTVKGTARQFAVYTVPLETIRDWPAELEAIFERSMRAFGREFERWQQSNLLATHDLQLFEALFDEEKREELLTWGLRRGTRYWRITLPSDMPEDMKDDGRGTYNFWEECLRHGLAAIGFPDGSSDRSVKRFADIRTGDRVVAFLRNKTIGGIGTVTSPPDKDVEKNRPADRDYFRGAMWQRIGVDWRPATVRVDDLPSEVATKFGRSTVAELSKAQFAEIEKRMPPPPDGSIAKEFKGFTRDAFDFLRDLAANNNKKWMDDNRDRWNDFVLEPMRALFTDLGPHVKRLVDPYLLPAELEITPTARKVLAHIRKNWAARPDSEYHEYYWGAFYRAHLSRQTDAQLFITMFSHQMRFGFFVGRSAPLIRNHFRQRVLQDPDGFYGLLAQLGLSATAQYGWSFETGEREVVDVQSADDLIKWVESGDYDLLRILPPDQVVAQGPALADTILDTFRRVFPIYLWAVADEYPLVVERYLETEISPDDEDELEPRPIPYVLKDFRDSTHLTEEDANELRAMLEDKKQVIFYGPPGTGKTFVARHLARLLTELAEPPPERLTLVQFHPAYGYEEFIEGIRPESEEHDGHRWISYPTRPGVFVRFCRAAEHIEGPCVFIIDEINRGNIPRIFGELLLLLEYRDKKDSIPLPYSGDRFRIPPNVYLIGTMNTADRSIALVDFALRRRFHFAHFRADPDLFERWLRAQSPAPPLSYLGKLYRELTEKAIDDAGYAIGPSVFMRDNLDEATLQRIWRWSIMPYLEEYYFDRGREAELWAWDSVRMRRIRETGGDGNDGS